MTKHFNKYSRFNRLLSRVNRNCEKTPKEKSSPEHDEIWDNFKGCVELDLSRLHRDATMEYNTWVIRESQCQPSNLNNDEQEEVEQQELLHSLMCDVEKQLRALWSFPAMKKAIEKCQKSHNVCEQQYCIELAVTSIVDELVALVDIFYKCSFSVTELRKMPVGTFAPYQKHLNVFSAWFKLRCVL
jgi:hypothetical protein